MQDLSGSFVRRAANHELEFFKRLVIEDFAAMHQAVVAMTGIGIEGGITDDADIQPAVTDGTCRPTHQIVWIHSFCTILGSVSGIGVWKQGYSPLLTLYQPKSACVGDQQIWEQYKNMRNKITGLIRTEKQITLPILY